ncbi:MAG: UvrD-helicase domain-containing protein, partial [Ruminiclostridium sp.]|nr:UvrD-helicase domain-containing protein [Ruminiclostridium sp.]
MNWTPEQEKAIAHSGGAAVVSAAAGSGKTAVLVERIVRLLTDAENPVPADRLVVVTFTEKAAGELKTRLNTALSAAVERDSANEVLKAQLVRLEDASISTISAFCLSLLRRYSALLSLAPDFTVAD